MSDLHFPPPPFISSARGLANLRDIGGYPITTTDPNSPPLTVRKGFVFRGPDPSPVDKSSLTTLKSLGIKTLFDLRSKQQIEKLGFKELPGIERKWEPVFGKEEYTPEKAALRYAQYSSYDVNDTVDAFLDILTNGSTVFRAIFTHISSFYPVTPSARPPAFLLHCTTGNNRSGVFVGIFLSFLGVSDDIVADEYALSEIGLAPSRAASVARLMKSPVFAGEGGRERCERMVGARRQSMLALLSMVGRRWGGAEGYLRGFCRFSREETGVVRSVMIVEREI